MSAQQAHARAAHSYDYFLIYVVRGEQAGLALASSVLCGMAISSSV